ncbi:MAG TPA: hypothetical protein PKE27_10760 [Povalibacter sp.]|uniref:hypothetical protein n=1 Tax=Povalibacter sp. TaxID=1962978 RepID=UPI002CD32AEE|nr:hypothetical protein [Povalibacter sp.]HMN45047.1 hypothetical protein [Povalibacter sp.]
MFIIKSRRKRALEVGEPIRHESHRKPVTRRDFLAQGFITGAATVFVPGMVRAELSPDIAAMKAASDCNIAPGNQKIPFICFDLAGGANIAGSNVLVGQAGGQMDFLSTQGYSKLGLPGDMLPSNPAFVNEAFGLRFHSDSAFLRGMLEMTSVTTQAGVNGAVIAARSENDTGNNPHNPMYGIARAAPDGLGAKGELLTLIGSQNSESGGNSMAPTMMIDPSLRPTKIDRRSDVVGLVDTGELGTILGNQSDTIRVLESMTRISRDKLLRVHTELPFDQDEATRRRAKCAYVKTVDTINTFGNPAALDPGADPDITAIFGANFGGNGEFQKTASVMKLVVQGNAGAGTISMGGFDYHTGDRATGERRDLLAGRCIGAVLEFAARKQQPVMIYVFSDGSLSSNGRVDNSQDGGGKGEWTGDNQATAASFFLVYNPPRLGGRPALIGEGTTAAARHQQLGVFSANGDVVNSSSPAANNVNLLVQTVLLNYMALHGESGAFNTQFGNALGADGALDAMTAFQPIVSGTVPPSPVA